MPSNREYTHAMQAAASAPVAEPAPAVTPSSVGYDEWEVAKVCHEANRAYCQALGDNSQPPWDEAPGWQKASAVAGVEFHQANPDAGPEASHESWMAQKVADGWTYGETKDPDAKTHPCIVPFDQLPREQQAKDFIFRAIVHVMSDC